MKRTILLIIIMAVFLAGCSNHVSFNKPVTFYYLHADFQFGSDDSLFGTEMIESQGFELIQILNLYLSGPVSETLKSPFPDKVQVLSLELNDGVMQLIMNDRFEELNGIGLSVANACLFKTCVSLTGIWELQIQSASHPSDSRVVTILHEEDFVTYDHHVTIPES